MTKGIIQGRVIEVTKEASGSELDGDHSSGDTTLNLHDVADFSESGGYVKINGVRYHYSGVGDDSNVLTISTGLATDLDDGEDVLLDPYSSQKVALVSQDDGDNSQTIEAVFTHSLKLAFALGRRPDGEGEWVVMHDRFGYWTIYEVIGQDEAIDPDLVPAGGGGADGGNVDDGFVLPTLAEFIFNGDPDYWYAVNVVPSDSRVYTEDESFDAYPGATYIEPDLTDGTLTYDYDYISDDDSGLAIFLPIWLVPRVGQDSTFTVDSATIENQVIFTDGDPASLSLIVESISDNPALGFPTLQGGRDTFAYEVHRHDLGTFPATDEEEVLIREWYSNPGPDIVVTMPTSSTTLTLPYGDNYDRTGILFYPSFIFGNGSDTLPTVTLTGVRMDQV